jgi:WD40 repeat protein
LVLWNLETGKPLKEQTYKDGTMALGYSDVLVEPETGRLVTWQSNTSRRNVQIWSPDVNSPPQVYEVYNVLKFLLAPDLKQMFLLRFGSESQHALDLFDLEADAALERVAENVDAAAFSRAAALLVYKTAPDGALHLWSFKSHKQVKTIERSGRIGTGWLAISSNGKWAAVVNRSPNQVLSIEVTNLDTGRLQFEYLVHGKQLRALAFQPNSGMLAVASEDCVELWDLEQQRVRKRFQGSEVFHLAFSSDGRTLAGSGRVAANPFVVLWDAAPAAVVTTGNARTLKGSGPGTLSQDGTRYASIEGPEFVLRELMDDREIVRISIGNDAQKVVLSPHGTLAAVSLGRDGSRSRLALVDLEQGRVHSHDAVRDEVLARSPYAARPDRDTTNASDEIFPTGGYPAVLDILQTADGYRAGICLVVPDAGEAS